MAKQRKSRKELIERAKDYLDEENEALSGAKKSRNIDKTKNRIDRHLKAVNYPTLSEGVFKFDKMKNITTNK